MRNLHSLVHVARALHSDQLQVGGLGIVGEPAQGPWPAVRAAVDDRPPNGAAHRQGSRRCAVHADGLRVLLERLETFRGTVAPRIVWIDLELHQVDPVSVGVRKAPGDVPIAADDDHRRAGERHSGHVEGSAGAVRFLDAQAQAKPGVRHRQTEMHVVGEHRHPLAGTLRRHRPDIAAERRLFHVGEPRARLAEGEGIALHASHVADLRDRHRKGRHGIAHQRRIPGRARLGQKRIHGRRQGIAQARPAGLPLTALVVQSKVHGEHHQHAVLGAP